MTTPDTTPGTSPGAPDGQVLADYLARTRWFGGKGRPFTVTAAHRVTEVPGRLEHSPHVLLFLVEVAYSDADTSAASELYQVPLACYLQPEGRLDHAFVGYWEDPELGWVHAYDALHDREAMACWQRSFERAAREGAEAAGAGTPLRFHRLPGHDLDLEAHSTLLSGEQSNSSVVFGDDALMKLFRKVTPGRNPDISIHEVLTRAECEFVADLYGWVELETGALASAGASASRARVEGSQVEDSEVIQLGMVQDFLRTATDGFDLALASVRTLFAEPDVPAEQSGGDFAGEAGRLGIAVAAIHQTLAEHFPTEARGAEAARALAGTMTDRLEVALGIVPGLAAYADRLRATFAAVGELDSLQVQTVHGDLHLGQTLRTATGWKVVDFEGEPAKPLAERLLPDSPWRDVAGMLRSFDYAPRVVARTGGTVHTSGLEDDEAERRRERRILEWSQRSREHFLAGYAAYGTADGDLASAGRLALGPAREDGGPRVDLPHADRVLLEAYIADKAVYEAVYETRNRPAWVDIPMDAIARITR